MLTIATLFGGYFLLLFIELELEDRYELQEAKIVSLAREGILFVLLAFCTYSAVEYFFS